MLDIAARLSRPFPLARIDFYETEQTFFVGEITLYNGNSMTAPSPGSTLQQEFGELLKLPLRSWPMALTVELTARLTPR